MNYNTSTPMNLHVNTNILPMAQPRVMYSVDSELFFLHTATMYLSPGEEGYFYGAKVRREAHLSQGGLWDAPEEIGEKGPCGRVRREQ